MLQNPPGQVRQGQMTARRVWLVGFGSVVVYQGIKKIVQGVVVGASKRGGPLMQKRLREVAVVPPLGQPLFEGPQIEFVDELGIR